MRSFKSIVQLFLQKKYECDSIASSINTFVESINQSPNLPIKIKDSELDSNIMQCY